MHLTLKKEPTRPAAANSLQQQARFDDFVAEFNSERPHEALDMKTPASVYAPSSKLYAGLPELTYPLHDRDSIVGASGHIRFNKSPVAISQVLAGQKLPTAHKALPPRHVPWLRCARRGSAAPSPPSTGRSRR